MGIGPSRHYQACSRQARQGFFCEGDIRLEPVLELERGLGQRTVHGSTE